MIFTREYGRALPGVRVCEGVASAYGSNDTVFATVSLRGVHAPWVIEGALNGDLFLTYLKVVLLPTLRRSDILVMDNLPTHKVAGVGECLVSRGARPEIVRC